MRALLLIPATWMLASCSILDGLGLFGGPGPNDGTQCTKEDPLCYASELTDVCDSYGGEVDDGDESVVTYSCVAASEVNAGPCEDVWGQLATSARDNVRIVDGFWDADADDAGALGRCFRGGLIVMADDDETHQELLALSEVALAIVDASIIGNGPWPGVITGASASQDLVNSEGVAAVEIEFCLYDASTQRAPSAIAAMITFDDDSTTHRRCLEKF